MKKETFRHLVFIPGSNKGRYPHCNSIYIDDEKKVIIDPGSDERVLKSLARQKGIDIIINSHYHEDHIVYNYLFPDAHLYVHESEADCYKSLDVLLDFYGITERDNQQTWKDVIINSFHFRERVPSREFTGGDTLNFGETTLEVIHTPGHSIGHCSFYFPEEEILFLGDLDLSPFGPWYGDRVSDIDQTIESIHKLMKIPAKYFISSHEMGIIKGSITEMAQQYLNVITIRESALMHFLGNPKTIDEIINEWIIYKKPRDPEWFFEFAERAMIGKHLERLLKNGRITLRADRYCLA